MSNYIFVSQLFTYVDLSVKLKFSLLPPQDLGMRSTAKESNIELLVRLIKFVLGADEEEALDILQERVRNAATAAASESQQLDVQEQDLEGVVDSKDLKEHKNKEAAKSSAQDEQEACWLVCFLFDC